MGLKTQPEWDELSDEHSEAILDSVNKIMDGEINSREESHDNFVVYKKANGWVYGEEYNLSFQTNPRLCEFKDLSLEDRVKESMFFECVNSFL